MCCTAALKNIEIIERDLLAHVQDVGSYLEQRLDTLRGLPLVGDVRCEKLMACVEFVADKASKALFADEVNIGERIHLRAQARGLLVRPIMHLNVMSPPLIITHAQVDEIVETLRECIPWRSPPNSRPWTPVHRAMSSSLPMRSPGSRLDCAAW